MHLYWINIDVMFPITSSTVVFGNNIYLAWDNILLTNLNLHGFNHFIFFRCSVTILFMLRPGGGITFYSDVVYLDEGESRPQDCLTIGSAGVGAESMKLFGEEYFGSISAILTLLILVLSEIIPKTIGASYWRSLAMTSTKIIRVLIFINYP